METKTQYINKQTEDPLSGEIILIDTCTDDAIVAFPSMKERYDIEYPEYVPEPGALNELLPLLKDKRIVVVLGTWCGDSREQLPRFLKIIDSLSIDKKNIIFICVNRSKRAAEGLLENLNIERVPTFIVYENEKELGRIIEKPIVSIEEDLILVLSKK